MSELLRPELRGLYAITPEGLAPQILLARVEATLIGGTAFIQYRDKCSDSAQRSALARALLALCHRYNAQFLVNDDLALALAIGADGVHLGRDDGDLRVARHALPPGKLLGVSCYSDFEYAREAVAAGADYVAFGAVYPSLTKPLAQRAPLSLFFRCRKELPVPVCAIGGITVDNARPLLAAGAGLLAVITDLFEAPDIAGRALAYKQLFEEDIRHEFT